jgi:hypothetical protein
VSFLFAVGAGVVEAEGEIEEGRGGFTVRIERGRRGLIEEPVFSFVLERADDRVVRVGIREEAGGAMPNSTRARTRVRVYSDLEILNASTK